MTTESENKGFSRRAVFGAIAGAAMTIAAALPGAAQAEEAPKTDIRCPAEFTVPCGDLRNTRGDVVRAAAANASMGNRIVLIHYGDDKYVIDNAELVIGYFNDHGRKAALVLADAETPDEESFQIYIEALPVTKKFEASTDPVILGTALNAAITRSAEVAAVSPAPSQGG